MISSLLALCCLLGTLNGPVGRRPSFSLFSSPFLFYFTGDLIPRSVSLLSFPFSLPFVSPPLLASVRRSLAPFHALIAERRIKRRRLVDERRKQPRCSFSGFEYQAPNRDWRLHGGTERERRGTPRAFRRIKIIIRWKRVERVGLFQWERSLVRRSRFAARLLFFLWIVEKTCSSAVLVPRNQG